MTSRNPHRQRLDHAWARGGQLWLESSVALDRAPGPVHRERRLLWELGEHFGTAATGDGPR